MDIPIDQSAMSATVIDVMPKAGVETKPQATIDTKSEQFEIIRTRLRICAFTSLCLCGTFVAIVWAIFWSYQFPVHIMHYDLNENPGRTVGFVALGFIGSQLLGVCFMYQCLFWDSHLSREIEIE